MPICGKLESSNLLCSPENYRRILETALDLNYCFVNFSEPHSAVNDQRMILLRHDVDYSVEVAAELAELNASCEVSGTFFVQLRSPIYNLFDPRNLACLQKISDCKQKLGLHYYCSQEQLAIGGLGDLLARDIDICERESGLRFERVIAWHNPAAELIKNEAILKGTGLKSAYAHPFFKDGHYFADSNLRNAPQDFINVLEAKKMSFLQFLFHPFYWILGGNVVSDILKQTMKQIIAEKEREFFANPNWLGRS